jgi:hypothetical protein
MLMIRQAQMDALSRARMADFEERLGALLAGAAPTLPASAIAAAIGGTLRQSRQFGLVAEADIARFGAITIRTFQGIPAGRLPVPALAILMSHGLDPQRKLDRYEAWAATHGRTGGRVQ